ncbi:MAG: DUF4335 domain-containing protein [Cyanobacteria bacterium J06623_4]
MTIRRQYQLPNCSLILDGLSIDPAPGNEEVMSLLVNAECRISGLERSINGGYNFFAALVRAVSQYSQEVLSGFAHPQVIEGEPLLVHINPGEGPYHHLVVQPEIADLGGTGDGRAIDIKLSAVQLFDLTEAVDQFFGDQQTLPELDPSLSPLPRRFVRTDEPLSDRAIPAVLGVGGLVAATMALSMLPVPELRDPALETSQDGDTAAEVSTVDTASGSAEPPTGETTPPNTEIATIPETIDSDTADTDTADTDTADTDAADAEEADGADTTEASGSDDETEAADAEAADSEVAESEADDSEVAEAGTDTDTETAIAISDFEAEPPANSPRLATVEELNSQLKQTIVENRSRPRFGDALTFRVRVNEEGTITGLRPEDGAANKAIYETPLPGLLETEAESDDSVDYRVVFTERGVVEVSPWWGWSYYE